jgi:hypothetical protein
MNMKNIALVRVPGFLSTLSAWGDSGAVEFIKDPTGAPNLPAGVSLAITFLTVE